ncbi:MAG: thioesterase [Desulfobacteraceae bacterium]|jgi:fluoroacetyl-CoA thioesterase|nr:MAG: thioesterase [Desulfobacteraceae bacterium]
MKTNSKGKSLEPGIHFELCWTVTNQKTVPSLFPESPEFQAMPKVFATGYLVGFIEWACILAVNPYIDWPSMQTVGTHINVSHSAATPPGIKVRAKVKLIKIEGRKLVFEVEVFDEMDLIAQGTHERFIVNAEKFKTKEAEKRLKM